MASDRVATRNVTSEIVLPLSAMDLSMEEPARSQTTDSADAEKSTPPEDQSGYSESDATVLTPTSALQDSDLPAGMTPRELAVALQGEKLDNFLLQQFVGGGGMGVVFKALDTTLDRVVAVKVVASRSISNEDLQRRFLIEAQSAARLDHPNIARVYDSGRSRGLPYIVFEYVEGANIRDLVVNHGPLPLGDALSYTYQIAHALAHAWKRDVVHRDIKPSNILVNQEGMTKLVDMGLARLYQVGAHDDDLTSTGVTLGTFDYISPEQARDPRLADTRSDIYSLGCTLFYMLAGHPPFSEGTAAQKLLQHQEEKPPELLTLRDDLPDSLDRLVRRMLAKRPEDRPQSSAEVVADLATIMRELGLQLPHALAPLPSAVPLHNGPSWRRHIPWMIPVATLLLVSVWMSAVSNRPSDTDPFPPILPKSGSPVEPKEIQSEAATEVTDPGSVNSFESQVDTEPKQQNSSSPELRLQDINLGSLIGEDSSDLSEPAKPSHELMSVEPENQDPSKQLLPSEKTEASQVGEPFGSEESD